MKKQTLQLSLFASLLLLAACGGNEKPTTETNQDSLSMTEKVDSVKNVILYNIPSPLETFTILKLSGGDFDKHLLSDASKASKFVSSSAKSVNLGVYSTDLAFCFLYKQKQDFNNYLKSINSLNTSLGIEGSYSEAITKRIEANSENLDSLMTIVSEAGINADAYLKENQRENTSALVAAGAWIEGMHILTSIATQKDNKTIAGLVADQKLSTGNVLKMLAQFESDADVAALTKDLKEIDAIYQSLQPITGNQLTSEDKVLKSIGNNTTYELSKEQLASVHEKIEAIRSKVTN